VKERLQKWAPRVGFPLFYVFSFVLFLSLVFPYDKLRDRIVFTFNAQQKATGAQQELAIDEMGWYWFTGVRAKGEPAKEKAEAAKEKDKDETSAS